ncbi:MAG TPA: DedA family protein [Pyrinomonadaceae bacterium]|jgi:membrane protein DedA with SNARE-associated domain
MSVTEQLLAAFLIYGLPVLFGVILIASIGLPLPVSFMLVAAGSFAKQGELDLASVMIVACCAAITGDHIGYGLSRWGGRRLVDRVTARIGGASKIKKAEALTQRWGAAGVFFSRWLVTELGPWINITSGITAFPWRRFVIWDVLGEILWVTLYVGLGYMFSDRVQYLAEILGNLAWVILGLIVAAILGWKVLKYFSPRAESDEQVGPIGPIGPLPVTTDD